MDSKLLKKFILASGLLLLVLLVGSCAESPTGRKTIKLYSKNALSEMGVQAFDGMKAEQKVSTKQVHNDYVNCVASYITKQVPKSVFGGNWELVVFEDDQVNAFALPGGKIGVYTGLLKVAKNQHQLAAVIGHEVGHVIAEHGNERMSSSSLIGIGMQAVNVALEANDIANSQMIMAGLGVGVQVGVQLPFSRTHETEADIIGLDLMARSGFDPRQSIELWKNMDAASGDKRQPEFLSTHPLPTTRIQDLAANMQNALTKFHSAKDKPNCSAS